jgi:hypothetical protein
MALEYEVSPARKLITVTAKGPYYREDVNNFQDALLADDRIVHGMCMLVDANGARPHLSFTDLQEVSKPLQQMFEKGIVRMALVSDSNFVYSIGRTFSVFAERLPVKVRTFRGISEAVAWLESAA